MLKVLYANNYRLLHLFILLTSILALAIAYYVEYFLEIAPCPLCIYQRFPYLSLIKISLTALIFKKISKYGLFFAICTLLFAIVIAGYHTGIEHAIFTPSALCSTYLKFPKHLSFEVMKKILYTTETPSCIDAGLTIFGFSMTEWNLALNIGILVVLISTFISKIRNAKT